jgi:hypothetical protein
MQRCRDKHWRCEVMYGSKRLRCLNRWDGHEKGHQFLPQRPINRRNSQASDQTIPIIKVGQYKNSMSPGSISDAVYTEIVRMLESDLSFRLSAISQNAQSSGVSRVVSNRTCLTCLSNCPAYVLPCVPCQHALCERCIERYSTSDHQIESVLSLERCPLGCHFESSPWKIRKKPRNAGARILTLDGYENLLQFSLSGSSYLMLTFCS